MTIRYPSSCRASVLFSARATRIDEFSLPERLDPGYALLHVEGSGMCGSDVTQFSGAGAPLGWCDYPLIPGHEPVGRIADITEEAAQQWDLRIGDRVAVEPSALCGGCRSCTQRLDKRCSNKFRYGFTSASIGPGLWGGYGEYMVLRPGTRTHRVDPELSIQDAVLFNPLASGFDWAVRAAGTGIGDDVLIIGLGIRGLAAVIACKEAGASRIIVAGRNKNPLKFELARTLGATHTIDSGRDDIAKTVWDITSGAGVDRALEVTPSPVSIGSAIDAVRPGGTVILAGVKGMVDVPLVTDKIWSKALTIRGVSGAHSRSFELAAQVISSRKYALELLHTHTFTIDNVARAVQLLAGEEPGEEVIHMTVKTY
jgi:threonine dehydrogenase-like Zn-dependent dehydrogenase